MARKAWCLRARSGHHSGYIALRVPDNGNYRKGGALLVTRFVHGHPLSTLRAFADVLLARLFSFVSCVRRDVPPHPSPRLYSGIESK